jgi:ABC-2 type transport system ATP-binding protein
MKRRLNIAGALLHEPDLILLDEPTVGVDPQSRNAIFDNLEELKRRGKTILYTTHYMEEAERLCDRVLILDHGQILANDTVAHLKQQYSNLEAAFMKLTGRALRDGAET